MDSLRLVSCSLLLLSATLVLSQARASTPSQDQVATSTSSEPTMAFNYDNGELTTMVADYAKASGRKMILDPGVRGKATVLLPAPVTLTEAWNILNDVFAINGYSIVDQGDSTIVKSARNTQRDAIPVVTTLPPPRPNRMVTLIISLKHISAEEVNKRLRILPSKDGEMVPYEPSNQIIVSDYASNLIRIAEIIKAIDTPSASASQFARAQKKPAK